MSPIDPPAPIRVVLCDDHQLFRRRLAEMLGVPLLQAARGMSNQQIATSLHLSEATVKRYLANTYNKIGVGSRTEATQKALANGWISSFELSEDYEKAREGRYGPERR